MVSKKQYFAIRAALSATEKEMINFYELSWQLKQHVPTVDEVVQYLNKWHEKAGHDHRVPYQSVNYYLNRSRVQKALDDRGIPWRQHSQVDLTQTQVAAAVTVMNMMDDRSIPEKLGMLGVNPTQYYAWLNDPQFKALVDTLADKNLAHIRPTAIAEFTKKINQGDWNAIKYWLETTGEVQSNNTPQSEVLLRMIVEIIQKHVKDPETIMAIAQDIKLASANRTLEVVAQPSITGEVVDDDIDLAQAKKMLGVS